MSELRFAIFGTGFWSHFQLSAWREIPGARCVALYNRTLSRARELGERNGIHAVYDDPTRLMESHGLDFVDIISSNDTHEAFTRLAVDRGIPAICQKPLGETLDQARRMVAHSDAAGVPLFVHENWRWQHQIRELKREVEAGHIGPVQRARIHYCNSFPVVENQPFLRELERFILTDIGTHLLDTARFLFGEPSRLYAQTRRVNPTIRGEDMATVMFATAEGVTVCCEMSYASRTEIERFPETYIYIEGSRGFLELGPDFWLRRTTDAGTFSRRVAPPGYAWADPAYACVHAAIVECNRNLLDGLAGRAAAETTGADNLRTLEMVSAAYESAETGAAVPLRGGQ